MAKTAAPKKGPKVMNEKIEATVKSTMDKASTFAKEATEFSKANIEAVVDAGKIAVKGAQTAAQNSAEFGRKSFEATTAALKDVAAVKTPTDFFQMQSEFVRSQFDAVVAETSKFSEFFLKLAGEVIAPVQNRYTVAAEQVKARMSA
jgi:phasin family protein